MKIPALGLMYGLIYVVLLSWVCVVSFGLKNSPFFLASTLGLSAFVMMWAHYFNGFLRETFFPDSDTKTLYTITKNIVFVCILLHPLFVSYYLFSSGYGLPPFNYSNFFGLGKAMFVYLGIVSLVIFLLYDFKEKLSKKNQTVIGHLSNLAMVLITVHALMLGYVLKNNINQLVFYVLGFTLLAMLGRLYVKEGNKTISVIGVALVILAMISVSYIVLKKDDGPKTNNKQTSQSTKNDNSASGTSIATNKISPAALRAKNGKNGNDCWVAIDGKVYNLTGSNKWSNGEHTTTSGVECGNDLSEKIKESPHGKSTLSGYPVVGSF